MPSNDKDHGIASGLGHEAMLQQAQQPTPPAPPAEMTVEKAEAAVIAAAMALYERELEARKLGIPSPAYRAWQQAETAMYEALAVLEAMGGDEWTRA